MTSPWRRQIYDDEVLDQTANDILAAVDEHGALLVHDRELPSVTALIVGEPVVGSWWSHPLANQIYNALGAIEATVATVKLFEPKQTLVAKRLWSALVCVGQARDAPRMKRLSADSSRLLDEVEGSPHPVAIDRSSRVAGKQLEERLLVYATDTHTANGHHVKALESWSHWATRHNITPQANPHIARASFDAIASATRPVGKPLRLPW